MNDDTLKKLLGQQHVLDSYAESLSLAAQLAAVTKVPRIWEEMSVARHALDEANRHQKLMEMAIGPVEALRRANILDLDVVRQYEEGSARKLFADYEAQFRRPEIGELARMVKEYTVSPVAEFLRQSSAEAFSRQQSMEAMCAPWLNKIDAMQSIVGFGELQSIGYALDAAPVFGSRLTEALRADLGDWRDRISWPAPIFTDCVARSDFYIERGFDPTLTDFPAPAFHESLDIAGLLRERPAFADRYGLPIPDSDNDHEEAEFARMNDAYDWLVRFETRLRRFIDEMMTNAFGADWVRNRLPNGLHERWLEKRRVAMQSGESERSLIAYADFTDYESVICRRDNWREVFAPFFSRPESVRESLQRLHPIRNCTMHARPITQDDELLLYVEVRRLVKVIR